MRWHPHLKHQPTPKMNPTDPKPEDPANRDAGGDCPSATCSAWREMSDAPNDGSEIVGWIPYKGHVLMKWDGCWKIKMNMPKDRAGLYVMGWGLPQKQPTAWREKMEQSTEWIY